MPKVRVDQHAPTRFLDPSAEAITLLYLCRPMDEKSFELREKLRSQMIENAAEINRIHRRIHETFKRRDESDELRQEWSQACAEAHLRYSELCLPGGWHPGFYDRLKSGDPETIEVALCFLEVRPYFFRSGYHWKTILQKCKRAPMSREQAERFRTVFEKYNEWRSLRMLSSERGAAVRHELWPVIRRFNHLFPVKIADVRFDGVATVGDLYTLLCAALKVEPLTRPDKDDGTVRQPCRAVPQADMSIWAREFGAWQNAVWTPEDAWATLVSNIVDGYGLDPSFVISPETILRLPSEK
jgi:hypothetical protein